PQRKPSRLSVELFRGFLEGRPDEEHWELIDGVAVMMAPPTLAHQRIASNLQLLLNEALDPHIPPPTLYQPPALNLPPPPQSCASCRKLRSKAGCRRHRQRRLRAARRALCQSVLSGRRDRIGERSHLRRKQARRLQAARQLQLHSDRAAGSLRSACRPAHER